jgi:hypothetical protein
VTMAKKSLQPAWDGAFSLSRSLPAAASQRSAASAFSY